MTGFKVGDRVTLTGTEWKWPGMSRGDVVTIVEIDEDYFKFADPNEWARVDKGFEVELNTDTPDEHFAKQRAANAVNPNHYQFPNGAEVRFISEWLTANAAQALQYIARSSRIDGANKGDAKEDIQKAIRFLEFELERLSR